MSNDPPRVNRLGNAFQLKAAEILTSELRFDQFVCCRADDHRIGLGQGLQTGSNVRGLANYRHLLRGSVPNDFAHDDEARGDANPHSQLEVLLVLRLEAAQSVDNTETAYHGPLSLILVGLGIAEIYEDAVSQILGDVAIKLSDGFGTGFLKVAYDHPEILRVQSRRQFRRSDEIAKHYGQLPAFTLRRCDFGGWRWTRLQRSDDLRKTTLCSGRSKVRILCSRC